MVENDTDSWICYGKDDKRLSHCFFSSSRLSSCLLNERQGPVVQRPFAVPGCPSGGNKLREDLILENNVKYAQLDPQDLLISQYYRFRKDYLANAEEIVSYIQGLEDERVGKTKTGCGYVKSVTDTKQCHKCGQVGHTARYCRKTAAAQNSERNKMALRKGTKLIGICC